MVFVILLSACCVKGAEPHHKPILVQHKKSFTVDTIDCERIPVGEPDDYKACVAKLPDGELLLTMFHQHRKGGGKILEQNLLYRSADGGKTWKGPERLDFPGREPYLSVLKDGTVLVTGHLLPQEVRNTYGHTCGWVHRSTDRGKTWSSTRVSAKDIGKPGGHNHTSRNVLELADGTLLMGVDSGGGPYFMWRSTDGGKTWNKSRKCHPVGFKSAYGFFGGETWLWQARSGKVIAFVRVDSREFPIKQEGTIVSRGDQDDHEMIWESADEGRTFHRVRDWGHYGQMYPSLLRLQDGRLLYTYTQRALDPPLGVRAFVGTEQQDGFTFDLTVDRLLLDSKTPKGKPQGGGFGPTVQLKDDTLVTSYTYRGADNKTHAEVVRWRLPSVR